MSTPPNAVQETQLVPIFQNSYLLLRRLEWIDESERPDGIEFDLPHADAELHRFDRDGDVAGGTSSRVRLVTPDDDWRFKPHEVLYPWPVDPFKPVMGLLPLGDVALSQLSDANSEELRAFRSHVLERVFVGQNTDQFFPSTFSLSFISSRLKNCWLSTRAVPSVWRSFRSYVHSSTRRHTCLFRNSSKIS